MNARARAAAIIDEAIERILEKLDAGWSLNRACIAAGTTARDFRWRRGSDQELSRRVDAARVNRYLQRNR
jgi:hypothetical protein